VSGARDDDAGGVVSGSPADLFENIDAVDAQLVADAAPFPNRPQPIGGSRRGVPNRRTQQMRDLYLRMGLPHPVLAMGSLLRLGIDGLARELNCDLIDAAELYRKVLADVAPYIEGKQPTKLVVDGATALPLVVVGDIGGALQALGEAREEGAMGIDDDVDRALARFQRNQRVSDLEREASHDDASHGDAKPLI
jgi:hypothetical protein